MWRIESCKYRAVWQWVFKGSRNWSECSNMKTVCKRRHGLPGINLKLLRKRCKACWRRGSRPHRIMLTNFQIKTTMQIIDEKMNMESQFVECLWESFANQYPDLHVKPLGGIHRHTASPRTRVKWTRFGALWITMGMAWWAWLRWMVVWQWLEF